MIFLILINRLNCKFKFSFYKLIFSLYFFLLKYYNKLDFNLLSQVKKNYFFFIWTDYIKKQFLDLFISNEVGLLNPL